MGIEYTILDLKNEQKFDLRKGPFGYKFSEWLETRTDGHTLQDYQNFCIKAWNEGYTVSDLDDRYVKEIATRIWNFCEEAEWNVELVNDHLESPYSAEKYWEWPVVDSR